MEVFVSFETGHGDLERIWLHALDVYMGTELSDLSLAHWLNPSVLSALILASGQGDACKEHLLDAARALKDGRETVYGDALYLLPHAILRYISHTEDMGDFICQIPHLAEYFSLSCEEEITPLSLGAYLDTQKLLGLINAPVDKNAIAKVLYHYRSKTGEDALTESLYSAYFDNVSDDLRQEVKNHLAISSFDVPGCHRYLLYDALSNLEHYDALLTAILEGGTSRHEIGEAAGVICAFITGLCGVNHALFGRGIYGAVSHMPSGIDYTLLMPYHNGVMVFTNDHEDD